MEDHSDNSNENNSPSEAMGAFVGMFGEMDIYAKIVLEEFLEVLLEKK